MDSVLLFNENSSRPIASVSMKDIPTSTLHNIIASNQYLALPRLSSQDMLEALCPCEWNKPRKRLCVVLVTEDSTYHDPQRKSFRSYAQNAPYSQERVRFAYIYHNKQTEFVNSLVPGKIFQLTNISMIVYAIVIFVDGLQVEPVLSVVILWRRDTSHLKYEWLNEKWETDDEAKLNSTTLKLENTISRLLRSTEALSYEAFVKVRL